MGAIEADRVTMEEASTNTPLAGSKETSPLIKLPKDPMPQSQLQKCTDETVETVEKLPILERRWDPECFVEMEIITDPHFLLECLRNRIIGQKRCDGESQFVILMTDHVLKGPYPYSQAREILFRKDFLIDWKTPHVVLPEEVMISMPQGFFLKFPHLSQGYPMKSKWHVEKFKTRFPTMTASKHLIYQVMRHGKLITLYEYMGRPNHDWIYASMPTLLLALIHCYILRIGDMCLSNILVDPQKHQIYLIDLDDPLTQDGKDEFFYFRSRPMSKRARVWRHQARPHYPWLIEQLRPIAARAPQFKRRIQKIIFMLARFVYTLDSSDSSDSSD
jgi:hypothetical protein